MGLSSSWFRDFRQTRKILMKSRIYQATHGHPKARTSCKLFADGLVANLSLTSSVKQVALELDESSKIKQSRPVSTAPEAMERAVIWQKEGEGRIRSFLTAMVQSPLPRNRSEDGSTYRSRYQDSL